MARAFLTEVVLKLDIQYNFFVIFTLSSTLKIEFDTLIIVSTLRPLNYAC
jgi:hypothetical protein